MLFSRKKKDIPLGLWMKCPECSKTIFTKSVEQNQNVCPECGYHMKMSARERIRLLTDEDSFEPLGEDLQPQDTLHFVDKEPYETKFKKRQAKTEASEAVHAGRGLMDGRKVNVCVMDFSFFGGSMGVVVGERVALAAEDALERKAPLIVVAQSGGARMHEGALSLMQMAKTSAVVARLREAKVPYIAVLVDPCTGGVSASFAAQGDITLAEPGALIGFAGPRVIQSTIKRTLPDGFQRAEFLLEKGYIDRIVPRSELKSEITTILDYLAPRPEKVEEALEETAGEEQEADEKPKRTKKKAATTKKKAAASKAKSSKSTKTTKTSKASKTEKKKSQ